MKTKVCSKCGIEKDISEFSKRKVSKDGYRNQCKECRSVKHKQYYLDNRGKMLENNKQYELENKDNISKKKKIWRLENKDQIKQYRLENKDRILERDRKYSKNNRDKINKNIRKKIKANPNFKLRMNMRSRIRYAINSQGGTKSKRTLELLGCTPQQARDHIENKFTDKMNWDNYGTYWEIDHIIPCASFDLTDIEQQKICFHYSNLQPLTVKDNRSKSDKLDWAKPFDNPTKQIYNKS